MPKQDIESNACPLADRQEYRVHQRHEFNAAVHAAAEAGGFLLDIVERDGETVVVLRREQRDVTPTEDARERVELQRQRLYDVCNLLATVAKAYHDLENDVHGSMEIAQREIEAVVDDLEYVTTKVLAVQS